jgi:hypothetical protein
MALEGAGMRGYGRVDTGEALNRAAEVGKELLRLDAALSDVSDSELSAYSTGSLPVGTFLQSKGQTFSVLTEEMLAEQFRRELVKREQRVTAAEKPKPSFLREHWKWVVTTLLAIVGIAAKLIFR